MKVRDLLLSIFGINIVIIAIFSIFLSYNLMDNRDYMTKATSAGIMYEQLNNDTRQAQVNFQRQVQEWKNILIRGNDKELYEKYLKGFNEREIMVQEELKSVLAVAEKNKLAKITPKIENLIEEHNKLGKKYREALASFNPEDPETGKQVDLKLRGIDRPASKAMDELSDDISKISASELNSISTTVKDKNDESLTILYIATAILLLASSSLLLYIRKFIWKNLGIEPNTLNEYFNALAQGHFDKSLDLEKDDKTSVAYHAKLMHFKLKNLVGTIIRMTEDIEKKALKLNIASRTESFMDNVKEVRAEIKGMAETVKKFKI